MATRFSQLENDKVRLSNRAAVYLHAEKNNLLDKAELKAFFALFGNLLDNLKVAAPTCCWH